MMIQLNPLIPVETPKGKAHAAFLIDYSQEHDLCWVTFLDDNGECWTFANPEIRVQTQKMPWNSASASHSDLRAAGNIAPVIPLRRNGQVSPMSHPALNLWDGDGDGPYIA